MNDELEEVWLTTVELAKRLGFSVDTIRRMVAEAAFPNAHRRKIGAPWRIPMSDVQAWLETTRPRVRRR